MSSQVAAFKALWESGRCDQEARDGRVIQEDPSKFTHLHPNQAKLFTFVFGPESLDAFLGKNGRQIAAHLEMPDSWIDQELERGHIFKMALFAPGVDFKVKHATWKGLEAMVCECYPQVSAKVCGRLPKIIQISTESGIDGFDALGGYSLIAAGEVGRSLNNVRSCPRFNYYWTAAGAEHYLEWTSEWQPEAGCHVTDEQMQSLKVHGLDLDVLVQQGNVECRSCKVLDAVEGTVVEVRQWLWDQVGLSQDYTGTGFTKGAHGTAEYFAANCPLEQLPGLTLIDLQM